MAEPRYTAAEWREQERSQRDFDTIASAIRGRRVSVPHARTLYRLVDEATRHTP